MPSEFRKNSLNVFQKRKRKEMEKKERRVASVKFSRFFFLCPSSYLKFAERKLFRDSLLYLRILHDFHRSRNNIQRKKEKKKGKAKKFLITDPSFPFLFPDVRNFFPFLFVRRHRSSIDLYEIFHCYRFQRYLPPCTSCFRLPSSVHPVPSNFAISPSLS